MRWREEPPAEPSISSVLNLRDLQEYVSNCISGGQFHEGHDWKRQNDQLFFQGNKMAGLACVFSGVSKLLNRCTGIPAITMRNESNAVPKKLVGMNWDKWPDHKMRRDVKRRKLVEQHAPMRVRLISLKRNDILPLEIREIASQDMDEIPRQAALRQIVFRCKLTSRPRGVVHRWGLSRMVFRDIADHNKMSGVQRAMW